MSALRPTWTVLPAKSLARGKSRLRPVLAEESRATFARDLLAHVLQTLRACAMDGVLVATDGDDVAELARAHGASVRRDAGEGSLAAVVDHALADVASRGARAALVLMADLPLLRPEDVAALLAALPEDGVALVPDHLGHHTNALAMAPPGALATCFGRPDSFAAHCAAARQAGLRVAVVDNERIAFDVDGPEDLARLMTPPSAAGT
jgi:2-phospho-L-lactate guanylyltransferase